MRLLVFVVLIGAVTCTEDTSALQAQKQKKVEKRGFGRSSNTKHHATSSVTISVGDAPPVTHFNNHDDMGHTTSDDHFDTGPTTTSSSLQTDNFADTAHTNNYDNGYGLVQSHAQSYSNVHSYSNDDHAQDHGNNFGNNYADTQNYGSTGENNNHNFENPFGEKDTHSQSFETDFGDQKTHTQNFNGNGFGSDKNKETVNYGNNYDSGKTRTQSYLNAVTHTTRHYNSNNNNNFDASKHNSGHSQNFGNNNGAVSTSSITQSFNNNNNNNDDFDNSHFNNFESNTGNQNNNNYNNLHSFNNEGNSEKNNNNNFEIDSISFTTDHPLHNENQSFDTAKSKLVNKYQNSYSQLYGGVHSDSAAKTQVNRQQKMKENGGSQTSEHEEINVEIQDSHENQEFSHDAINQAEVLNVYLGDKPRIEMHKNPRESEVIHNYRPADTGRVSGHFRHMDWTPGSKPSSYHGADVPVTPPIKKHCSYDRPKVEGRPLSANKEVIKSITVFKEHKYPVPKPYPVAVVKHIGVPVYHRVPYHVEKPYPVYVAKPYRVPIYKHVPYTIVKHIPFHVHVPVKVPVFQHYPVHVDKLVPYHVPFQVKTPVPQHYDVHKPVVINHQEIHRIRIHEH